MNNKPYEISLWDDIIIYSISPKFGADYPDNNGATTFTFIEEPTVYEEVTEEVTVEGNDTLGYTIIQESYSLDIESLDDLDKIYPNGWEIISWRVEEKKIGVIGSNTITAQHRAFNGKLVSNVNGQNTLTFSIYQKYYDNQTGEFVENPFIRLLTNERKIKLRLGADDDAKWYDFIIKNVQESSDSKVFSFTCTDLFMNELSKVGFSVKLDAELENNIGTVTDLAQSVVEMTDWDVLPVGEGSDLIHSFVEEPLYQLKIAAGGTAIVLKPVVLQEGELQYTFESKANYELYGFYSAINSKSKTIQVLCKVDNNGKPVKVDYDSSWPLDETLNVIASEHIEDSSVRQFVIENVEYKEDGRPNFVDGMNISTKYRGRRIVRSQVTKYDANLGKYVSKYLALDDNGEPIEDDIYWCFAASDIDELTVLHNYVTNPKDFTHTKGWEVVAPDNATNLIKIDFKSTYTGGAQVDEDGSFVAGDNELINVVRSCITFEVPDEEQVTQKIYNSGLWNYLYDYDKITKGEQFVVRIKQVKTVSSDNPWGEAFTTNDITPKILFFSSKWLDETDQFFDFEEIKDKESKLYDENYVTYRFTCLESLSHEKIISGYLGLCLEFPKLEGTQLYALEELQVFKQIFLKEDSEDSTTGQMNYDVVEKESEATKILTPGEYANTPLVMPTYYVYKDGASEKQNLDSMTYDLETKDKTILEASYTPYFDPYSAARIQISASESNCFNILQDIAENSQSWVKFTIKHEATGHIQKDNGKPIKQISFHKFVGKKNYAGFKYGINLKSIQRTVESNQLTTKLIVKPNSNEFAENKQCAIGKAPSNPIKEDFIYNFDYYIKQGMLSSDLIFEDLYGKEGFYTYLKEKNVEVEKKSDQVAYYSILNSDMEAEVTAYKKLRDEAVQNRAELISDIYSISKYEYNYFIQQIADKTLISISGDNGSIKTPHPDAPTTIQGLQNYIKQNSLIFEKASWESWFSQNSIYDKLIQIQTLNAQIINANMVLYNTQSAPLNEEAASNDCLVKQFKLVSEKYEELKREFAELQKQKQDREREFYTKYSRYIQEGTWNSEDFYDNELYYLEALNVSAISSMPKISYTINVIDVSQIEDLENIDFDLGDQTYMQDVEFFGYVKKSPDSSILTPYSEEIVCTEISRTLDDPSQNTIKVQNYKNQFEDLFQRMTAATQQIQYKAGEYQKAANAFSEDGEIKPASLQKAFENNKLMLNNATDQSVTWDNTGITAINLKEPNLQTRIIGGAIMVTNDGDTWHHAITGDGINASLITAGKISVGEVTLETGDQTSFRWDNLGISAYRFITDNKGEVKHDPYTFVRLDSFGLYGIDGNKNFAAMDEDAIWNAPEAKFGLTWKGFFLHSDDGAVQITSNEYIQVFNGRPQKDEDGNYTNLKIKIGNIGTETNKKYGILILDDNGPVITQDDDGNITITGALDAKRGRIGGWDIDQNGFSKSSSDPDDNPFYFYIQSNPYSAENEIPYNPVIAINYQNEYKFYVRSNGYLYAKDANITGRITAEEGQIGRFKIRDGGLVVEDGVYPYSAMFPYGFFCDWDLYLMGLGGDFGHVFSAKTKGTKSLDCYISKSASGVPDGDSGTPYFDIQFKNSESNYFKMSVDTETGITLRAQHYGRLVGSWNSDSALSTDSDLNLKNSISLFNDKYEIFYNELVGRVFKYNNGTSNRLHCGFIAQEVGAALSKANLSTQDFGGLVIKSNTNGNETWHLRYAEFISLNTWQIQKLKSRVSELESELSILKQKFETFSNL